MDGADYSQCLKAANNFYDDIGKIEKDYNKRSKRQTLIRVFFFVKNMTEKRKYDIIKKNR